MQVSMASISIYIVLYSIYAVITIRRYGKKLLGPTVLIILTYWLLMFIAFINNAVILSLRDKISIKNAYDEHLIFRMFIRRFSVLILFKVMFTLKRVVYMLNPRYDTKEKLYHKLFRIICLERVYFISFFLLMMNTSILIVMFLHEDYEQRFQSIYEMVVMIVSPIFWLIKIVLVYYFY